MNLVSKLLKTSLFLAVFFGLSLNAYEEGKDYLKLDKPIPNAQNTLIKVFSYDCPFCYKYDKAVTPKVVKEISVKFVPYHLSTKGVYGKQASELFAVLLAKDLASGADLFGDKSLLKKAKFAYYGAYHDKKERWKDGKDPEGFLKTGLDASGISKADFEKGLKDPKVQEILKAWGDKDGNAYNVAKIQGVPGFVVNGKYLIYTKKIKSIKQMAEMINEIAKK